MFSFFFNYIPRNEIAGSYINNSSIFSSLRNLHSVFPQWLHRFTFPLDSNKGSLFLYILANVCYLCPLRWSHSGKCKVMSYCVCVVLICISLMIHYAEHLFICLMGIWMSSLKRCLFRSSAHVLIGLFVFSMLSCISYFYTLCIRPWTVARQTHLSKRFSRQEYWSGLPLSSSRGSSWSRDWTQVSFIPGSFFTDWATGKLS